MESWPIRAFVISAIVAGSILVGVYANGDIDTAKYEIADTFFTVIFRCGIAFFKNHILLVSITYCVMCTASRLP